MNMKLYLKTVELYNNEKNPNYVLEATLKSTLLHIISIKSM